MWIWLAALAAGATIDWSLTRWLVENGEAVEGNPIAATILEQFGWAGLALFKVSSVVLVGVLGLVIARKNRSVAQRVLQFACACTFLIVGYTCILLVRQEIETARVLDRETVRSAKVEKKRHSFLKIHQESR